MPPEISAVDQLLPTISLLELSHCPSCGLDEEGLRRHAETLRHEVQKSTYWPVLYKDRLLNTWLVECMNCGFKVIFGEVETEVDAANYWNALPRNRNQSNHA